MYIKSLSVGLGIHHRLSGMGSMAWKREMSSLQWSTAIYVYLSVFLNRGYKNNQYRTDSVNWREQTSNLDIGIIYGVRGVLPTFWTGGTVPYFSGHGEELAVIRGDLRCPGPRQGSSHLVSVPKGAMFSPPE